MSIFAHISVFVSLILGLAVVHLLGGISLILDTKKKTKVYWIHLIWTFNMLFTVVLVWLSSFVLSPLEEMGVLHFLNLLAYSTVTYLMCGLLYPVQGEEITDFEYHFNANRFRFFLLGIVYVLVDATDGILEYFETNLPLDIGQFATLGVWLVVFTIALKVKHKLYDAFVVLVFTIGLIGWLVSLVDTGVLSW